MKYFMVRVERVVVGEAQPDAEGGRFTVLARRDGPDELDEEALKNEVVASIRTQYSGALGEAKVFHLTKEKYETQMILNKQQRDKGSAK